MNIHTSSPRGTYHLHLDTALASERLDLLTEAVETALASDPDHPPTLVAATGDDRRVQLLMRPLDHHPAIELEGFVAPASWWCLGIVSGGTARSLDVDLDPVAIDRPARYPIHLAHLIARSGRSSRRLRDRRTDTVLAHRSSNLPAELAEHGDDLDHDHDGGLLDDYLRRALQIPTPPPARDTTELYAALWIHHVMNEAALHHLLDADWSQVAGLHPVIDRSRAADGSELHAWATENLVRAGELMAEANPWARVRSACQLGIGPFTGRPAELAGWLDDGAFSRVVLSSFGSMTDLLVDLHELVRPEVHARIIDTVDAWGLLDTSPP